MSKKTTNVEKKPLVVVAMSGGVDSSVAAALLLKQGYRVIGITMKLWEFEDVGGNPARESACCSIESMNDAALVCRKLGVPHYVVDFQEEFRKWVVENFVSEYLAGRTPNPCVICNSRIKWETLLVKARSLGAEYLATGHYARVERDASTGRYLLKKGVYSEKDQSYALWGLTQDSLAHTLFPLGELTKPRVREIAAELGLRTAGKRESQEICFVPDNDYRRLIREKAGEKASALAEGEFVSPDGEFLGKHSGYPNFTIGQRRGLGIALGRPVYVVDIRPETNQVVVGDRAHLFRRGLRASRVNWIAVAGLETPRRLFVKIRYKDPGAFATVKQLDDGRVEVRFEQPQRAVTPGQSVVFYDGDTVVGGGVIDESFD